MGKGNTMKFVMRLANNVGEMSPVPRTPTEKIFVEGSDVREGTKGIPVYPKAQTLATIEASDAFRIRDR